MKAKRTYKDSLFRHMFKHKRRITHLYAALSGNHVDPRDITFRTLRGTFFNDVKNDISFLVENRMVILLEQQSTWNPNMPLRFLWYLARLYRNIVPKDVPYHSRLVSLPTPEFYVLYNGMQAERDYQVLHLSDAFPARTSVFSVKQISPFSSSEFPIVIVGKSPLSAGLVRKHVPLLHPAA